MADVNESANLAPVTDEDRAVAEAIISGARGYAVKLPNDGHTAIQLVAQHRIAARAAPPAMDREALQKGLEFAVLTLAFHGRDRGTDREAKMLDDLEQLARELDPLMRQAIASLESRLGHPDDEAVNRFATQMKAKLSAARAKGRGGWDDPAQCSTDYLRTLLHEHVAKGDPVDVANFCMMLAHYGASTTLSADAIRQGEGCEVERLRKALERARSDLHLVTLHGSVRSMWEEAKAARDRVHEALMADPEKQALEPDTDDVRRAIHRLTELAQEENDPPAITKAMIWSYLHGKHDRGGSEAAFRHRSPTGDKGPVAVGKATQAVQIGDADAGKVTERPSMQREAEGIVADHQFKPHVCECGERFCTGSELTWHQVQHHDLAPIAIPASHASDGGEA